MIAQLKANQPSLLAVARRLCQCERPATRYQSIDDKARSRYEKRIVEVFQVGPVLKRSHWNGLILAVIRVQRYRLERNAGTGLWKSARETAYYVAGFKPSAELAAAAIRGHWGIENRLHYIRDTTMAEDASRVRKNPGIMARIRSFAANLLRANNVKNMAEARYRNALGGIGYLAKYRFM